MYRHNPLPFDISKYKNKNPTRKRNIVFSSPKLAQIANKPHSNQKVNHTKSQSKQKSIHRIDSKQKPRILTPYRPNKTFEQSTAEYQNSLNISPAKTKCLTSTPSYFKVTSLLKNQPTADSSLKESLKKSFVHERQKKIMRIENKSIIDSHQEAIKKLKFVNKVQGFDIELMIEENKWEKYEGQTQNGLFQGYGILYFTNGDKYSGFFHKNLPEQHGSFYQKGSDEAINGIWQKGKLIQTF